MNEINEIQYINTQQETLIKWIKSMPISQKKCIKNILSVNSGNGYLDDKVIKLLPNIKNYNIVQSDYNNYQNCINRLFGNFKFKVSYSDLFDYDFDTLINYDLIIFFDGFGDVNDCASFIQYCTKFIKDDGKIWIFTHDDNGCINKTMKHFNYDTYGDKTLKNALDKIRCKIFNTHIPTYLDLNELTLDNLNRIAREKCKEHDFKLIKDYIRNTYGNYISVPISVVILSKLKCKLSYL